MANPRDSDNLRRPGWGAWVRHKRKALHLSGSALAAKMGWDFSHISLIEKDDFAPRYERVLQLALALEAPVDETLLRAGYAPHLGEDAWAQILADASKPVPELRAACQLHDLTPAEQRSVAAFLAGVRMAVAS